MNRQKHENHVSRLQEKHDELDLRIDKAHKTHHDQHIIAVLKKEQLALKDEIEKLKKQLV